MRKLAVALLAIAIPFSAQSQTLDDDLPQVFTLSPTGVDMRSGKLVMREPELSIHGETYIRGSIGFPSTGSLRHNMAVGVRVASKNNTFVANVHVGEMVYRFRWSSSLWVPDTPESVGSDLYQSGSSFILRSDTGDLFSFFVHPAISSSIFPNGLQLLAYHDRPNGERISHSYDASGRLQSREYSRGFGFRFEYDPVGNLIRVCARNRSKNANPLSVACGSADKAINYTYTALNGKYRISRITYPDGSYRDAYYHLNPTGEDYEFLRCLTVPNTSQCEVENWYGPQPGEHPALTKPNQVRRQRMATGEEWTYRFNTAMLYENPQQPGEIRYTDGTMIDPTGHSVVVIHANGLLHNISGMPGASKFKYDGTRLTEYEFPEGNKITLQYDRNNIFRRTGTPKPGSGEAPIVQTATYPLTRFDPPNNFLRPVGCVAASQKLCDKPITITDGRDHVTDYTYDAAHGGVLTETGPAAANGVRPSKQYSYVQRHAWIGAAGGGYVQAATPIWLLNDERHCRNSAPSGAGCAVPSDLVVTSYEYENGNASTPSNLLLKGVAVTADGQTLRTCYGYDQWGQKISESKPLAGLGACP